MAELVAPLKRRTISCSLPPWSQSDCKFQKGFVHLLSISYYRRSEQDKSAQHNPAVRAAIAAIFDGFVLALLTGMNGRTVG
jgi:hypothetical protein